MLVPSKSWPEIVAFYENLVAHGLAFHGLRDLTRRIAESRYAGGVHATTSMHTLLVAQTREFDFTRQILTIDERRGQVAFAWFEERQVGARWTRECAPSEAWAVFEHFVLRVEKWWSEHPPLAE